MSHAGALIRASNQPSGVVTSAQLAASDYDMQRAVQVTVVPAQEPITVLDAREHVRQTQPDDDGYLSTLITTARLWCERRTNRAFITQTLKLTLDRFPYLDTLEVPRPPLQSVTSIIYTLDDGTTDTMSASDYVVDSRSDPGRIVLQDDADWPSDSLEPGGAVAITYVAGYGTEPEDVPAHFRHAIRLLVGHWYVNREAVMMGSAVTHNVKLTVDSLLNIDRNYYIP